MILPTSQKTWARSIFYAWLLKKRKKWREMSYDSYINTRRGIPFSVHAGIKTKIDKTSHLPTLTTWHCSHSSAACRCCRIDRYLLSTAANRHQRVFCCWPMLGQTSYRFIDPVPHTMRAVPVTHGGRWNLCITLMATTMMSYYTGWAKKNRIVFQTW